MDLVPGLATPPPVWVHVSLAHALLSPSPSEPRKAHVCIRLSAEGGSIYLRLHWSITLPMICSLLERSLAMQSD